MSRPLESASLVLLAAALLAIALRSTPLRAKRALVGATAFTMALAALVEGARWQLALAYALVALGALLVLRRGAEPRAGGRIGAVLRVASAVVASALAAFLPIAMPVPSFPAPDGPHVVGTVTFVVEDPTRQDPQAPGRPRRLMAQAWYPSDASAARTPLAPYLFEVKTTGPALAALAGLPSFFANHLAYAVTHAHLGAPFDPSLGRAPLLVFSHGFGAVRASNTTTAEALASRGYVVVAIDHTYDAAVTAFPDGSVVLRDVGMPDDASAEDAERVKTAWVRIRAADVRLLADVLGRGGGPDVLAGHVDAARMGVFGHSLGGSTAAEVCRLDARFLACADLDGFLYGDVRTEGMAQPFLLVEGESGRMQAGEVKRRAVIRDAFFRTLRGPSCRVRVAGAQHLDFTDFTAISPLLPYIIAGNMAKHGGEETLSGANQAITAFFDATVRGDAAGWSRLRAARPRFSSTCERLTP